MVLRPALALLATATLAAAQEPAFVLPAPTGRFAVGTTSWVLVDSARQEFFSSSGARRSVEVVAWYPAKPVTGSQPARAPYLREGAVDTGLVSASTCSASGATRTAPWRA